MGLDCDNVSKSAEKKNKKKQKKKFHGRKRLQGAGMTSAVPP